MYETNKGVSLVIAMIFIPIIMLLAAMMMEPIIQSYRTAVASQKQMLTEAIAFNVLEEALYLTKDLQTGSVMQGEFNEETMGYGDTYGKFTATWSVSGQPETDIEHSIDGQYYVPSLGTGDVGGDYCSSAAPVYDAATLIAALKALTLPEDLITDPADWPCNWGKLKEGESLIIPLYSHNEFNEVVNPGDINFELRLRAACNPQADPTREDAYRGEICDTLRQERYLLAGEGEVPEDTVIALWEITGKKGDENGESVYLSGYQKKTFPPSNSNINVDAINGYTTYQCTQNTLCNISRVVDQVNQKVQISYYLSNLYKPTLRLIVVHSLKEDGTNNKVPYVEYQFRTDTPGTGILPVSNSSKIVKVEVMVDGGYTETIEKTIALPKPVTGFVIQQ